jgi:hypothetical protein
MARRITNVPPSTGAGASVFYPPPFDEPCRERERKASAKQRAYPQPTWRRVFRPLIELPNSDAANQLSVKCPGRRAISASCHPCSAGAARRVALSLSNNGNCVIALE